MKTPSYKPMTVTPQVWVIVLAVLALVLLLVILAVE
jgi:hypothetical protein